MKIVKITECRPKVVLEVSLEELVTITRAVGNSTTSDIDNLESKLQADSPTDVYISLSEVLKEVVNDM